MTKTTQILKFNFKYCFLRLSSVIDKLTNFYIFHSFLKITQDLPNFLNCSITQMMLNSSKSEICEKMTIFDELKESTFNKCLIPLWKGLDLNFFMILQYGDFAYRVQSIYDISLSVLSRCSKVLGQWYSIFNFHGRLFFYLMWNYLSS